MKKYILFFVFFFLALKINYAQNNVQIGAGMSKIQRPSVGAFYDYADPAAVNIKVSIWGFVRYPGKYIIPSYSNVNDLLSYAGGPTSAARLEDLRLIRTNPDSSETIIPLHYKDLLFNFNVKKIANVKQLKAGDILMVGGEPRLYFKDYLQIGLSIVSTLISLSILFITLFRK